MTYIVINEFGGIAPVVDANKLQPPHGQLAVNCLFEGGNLRPERAPVEIDLSYSFQTTNTGTLFRLSDVQWLRWQGDVSVVISPTPQKDNYLSLGRDYEIIYAGDTGETPKSPRFTSKYRAMGNQDPAVYFEQPSVTYPLGVPPPQSVPVVALGPTPGGQIISFRPTDPVEVAVLDGHNLSNGNRVIINTAPASGDASELRGNQYSVSIVDPNTFKLVGTDGTEWAGVVLGNYAYTRTYTDQELEDRIYVYTYVTEFGAEGKPSAPSAMVSVGDGQSVVVSMDVSPTVTIGSGPTYTVAKKRIYRSVSGTNQAEYLFVAEVDISTGSYIDVRDFAQLGEVCPTENFDLPPNDLEGLCVHPSGYLLGFVGNALYASEPYLPYAWPADYRKILNTERIVRVLTYGPAGVVVVLTNGRPFIGGGTDPASLSVKDGDQTYPCVHRQAAVSTGYSCVYVSPVGLIAFDQSGPRNLTDAYYSPEQWQELIGFSTGARVALEWQDSKVWMSVEGLGLISFHKVGERLNIVTHPVRPTALAVNAQADALFVMYGGSDESERRLWRTNGISGGVSQFQWRSGDLMQGRPINFGWCQVFATAYDDGASQDLFITISTEQGSDLYVVGSGEPFRLKAGFLAREWTIGIIGNNGIKAIHLAEQMAELKAIVL